MDGICSAILNKIYALGTVGRYFVISADEFFESFPEDGKRDENELKRALRALSAEGYVDIKYSDGNMYCVALLKAYTNEVEPPPPPNEQPDGLVVLQKPQKTAHGMAFLAAFAGGALGSAIVSAITWIVAYVK